MRLALDRSRFILRQQGPAGAQVTTVNRRGLGGVNIPWGYMLSVSNQMSTCATGFPPRRVANVGAFRKRAREIEGTREMSDPN